MNIRQSLIAAACMSLGAGAIAQSAAPTGTPRDADHLYTIYPASKIIGLDLRNDSEKNVGEIGDLLVDPSSGEIRYAVLDVGGFLGMGEDHRIVPWNFVQVVPDEKDADKVHGRTTLTEQQVKAAPTIKPLARLEADLDKRIEASFGKNDGWAYAGKGEPTFAWCSEMCGLTLKDKASKEIGKLQQLILAPSNGCIAYAVVDTTKEAGDKHVAVPIGRLNYSYDRDHKLMVTTSAEMAKFATAPEFDSKDWKRMSSTPWLTELGTYYSCDPFWKTSRFAAVRKAPTPQRP